MSFVITRNNNPKSGLNSIFQLIEFFNVHTTYILIVRKYFFYHMRHTKTLAILGRRFWKRDYDPSGAKNHVFWSGGTQDFRFPRLLSPDYPFDTFLTEEKKRPSLNTEIIFPRFGPDTLKNKRSRK